MNKSDVILYKYPFANPMFDFVVEDHGDGNQVIGYWCVKDSSGNPVPTPTDGDLNAWHQEMLANPKSQEPTVEDRIAAIEFTLLQQMGL